MPPLVGVEGRGRGRVAKEQKLDREMTRINFYYLSDDVWRTKSVSLRLIWLYLEAKQILTGGAVRWYGTASINSNLPTRTRVDKRPNRGHLSVYWLLFVRNHTSANKFVYCTLHAIAFLRFLLTFSCMSTVICFTVFGFTYCTYI